MRREYLNTNLAGRVLTPAFPSPGFDHWGERHHTYSANELARTVEEVLALGASVNLYVVVEAAAALRCLIPSFSYMFHGGTNFGFYNGANGLPFAPDTTSYDYDALLTEAGQPTPKYYAVQAVIKAFRERESAKTESGPPPPMDAEELAAMDEGGPPLVYDPVTPFEAVSLFDLLDERSGALKRGSGIGERCQNAGH